MPSLPLPWSSRASPWQLPALLLDILTFGVFFLVFCLFPSGRFVPSWLGFLPVGWIVWGVVAISLHAVPRFYSLYLAGFLCALIVIASAQVYRYRRVSTLGERQQTKWVVWGASIAMMSVVSISLPGVLMPSLVEQNWLYRLLDAPALTLALFLGAFSIGMAILRSHLWNIDVLINRTLVYSTLTGCLACVYVSLVMALQFLLRGLFSHTHDVALVASTLAIAALFHPLRRRIQHGIDRRFYRSKYDGAQTLLDFSVRLRSCDDVDLATLTNDLLSVVEETMQPAHVSLWLRPHTWEVKPSTRLHPRIDVTPTETDPESVLLLKMVDKSNSPLQTRFGPVFGDVAVQAGLLSPE